MPSPETTQADQSRFNRRALLGAAGVAAVGAFVAGSNPAAAQAAPALSEGDVFNFALNLEYLEAEFYLRAVTGAGLPDNLITGSGTAGTVNAISNGPVPWTSTAFQQYATRLAEDEQAHINLIRSYLGVYGYTPIARPAIDLNGAFTALAVSAGLIAPGQIFDPFADELSFTLAAYSFIDVGLSAYAGGIGLLTTPTLITQAGGLLGTEATHAGAIRGLLSDIGGGAATDLISAARQMLSGVQDLGVVSQGLEFNFENVDYNGLAIRRTPQQVLNIVYQKIGASSGGFFPAGVNGAVTAGIAV